MDRETARASALQSVQMQIPTFVSFNFGFDIFPKFLTKLLNMYLLSSESMINRVRFYFLVMR